MSNTFKDSKGNDSSIRWALKIGVIMSSILIAFCIPAMFYAIYKGQGEIIVATALGCAFGIFGSTSTAKAIQKRYEASEGGFNGGDK